LTTNSLYEGLVHCQQCIQEFQFSFLGRKYEWPCCRREAARCFVSVSSFHSTIRGLQVSLQIYGCVQSIFVLFSSSWFTMLVVINKDSLMRCGLRGKLHGRPCCLHCSIHRSIVSYWSRTRDFCQPHLHSTPLLGGSMSEYCRDFWYRNIRMV